MIKDSLDVADVVAALVVDMAMDAEIHKTQEEVSPEIPTLGAHIAKDQATLNLTVFANTKTPEQPRASPTGALPNQLLLRHNILHQ